MFLIYFNFKKSEKLGNNNNCVIQIEVCDLNKKKFLAWLSKCASGSAYFFSHESGSGSRRENFKILTEKCMEFVITVIVFVLKC